HTHMHTHTHKHTLTHRMFWIPQLYFHLTRNTLTYMSTHIQTHTHAHTHTNTQTQRPHSLLGFTIGVKKYKQYNSTTVRGYRANKDQEKIISMKTGLLEELRSNL